jgi:DNA primase
MILREKIDKLKKALTVPEYFRTAGFKPKGIGTLFIICPFHKEKTPSCFLYPDHYHCYGCGEHGDVIDAHMKLKGIEFAKALEDLGRLAGIDR